ncbi:ABC transporter ATP-binding protein [Gracilibacillus alcaliphilus]|uniref:ABC transporter ATP-binding protein n=1 Tax=Gracilibacillus alcaliphilus TaxID=1401441 RepID=UPI001958BB51|nr:ABC transporter ATP-binding protein [Gracilibacillus alcaliphilus]MBM7678274.1 ABC-type multidrug transport system ATPase subunit [Gracilibacillus alcaliphilus]
MEQCDIAVDIQGLSKRNKKKQLLLPLDYHLSSGKILALCGGNGAGKSTLIRLIVGLIKPTTGHVTINGLNRKKHKQLFLKQFGYMPDDFQFQKSMTTKETIHFYSKIKSIGKTRYEETLEEVGLLDKLNEKVGNFSKGMNQRLLLAQALLANPNILILDEPTNGLDPYWVKQFCDLMLQAKKNGQTIIFSTHDLHIAEQIADEVLFLSEGEVISKTPINQYRDTGLYETFQQLYCNSIQEK